MIFIYLTVVSTKNIKKIRREAFCVKEVKKAIALIE